MTKSQIIGILFLLMILGTILLSGGCFRTTEATPGAETPSTATAQPKAKVVAAVAESVRSTASGEVLGLLKPLFSSGYLLIAAGAVVALLGGRASGMTLAAFGFFSVYTGVVFAQYSTVALIITALILVAVGYELISRRRAAKTIQNYHDSTSILAEAVQTAKNGKEIKNKIKAKGADAVKTVRAVVDPIKEELGI